MQNYPKQFKYESQTSYPTQVSELLTIFYFVLEMLVLCTDTLKMFTVLIIAKGVMPSKAPVLIEV